MNKSILILNLSLILTSQAYAVDPSTMDSTGFITEKYALSCIQLNKDLNLASTQMLMTEKNKQHLKNKVDYLQEEISKRRSTIERLDQRNNLENNENYNQLVDQFEDLREEHKQTIGLYNEQHQLHISQHNSVIRLEQRFSGHCLDQVQITKDLYNQVCQYEEVRWCEVFSFN